MRRLPAAANIICQRVYRSLARGAGAGDEQDCQDIKNEHHGEEGFCLFVCAGEFFPHEDAPERCDHGRGLADGVGYCDAGEICSDQIKNGSGGPYCAAYQAKQMPAGRAAKKSAEAYQIGRASCRERV